MHVQGIVSVAFSPLGHGDLSMTRMPEVEKIAKETGRSPIQASSSLYRVMACQYTIVYSL